MKKWSALSSPVSKDRQVTNEKYSKQIQKFKKYSTLLWLFLPSQRSVVTKQHARAKGQGPDNQPPVLSLSEEWRMWRMLPVQTDRLLASCLTLVFRQLVTTCRSVLLGSQTILPTCSAACTRSIMPWCCWLQAARAASLVTTCQVWP